MCEFLLEFFLKLQVHVPYICWAPSKPIVWLPILFDKPLCFENVSFHFQVLTQLQQSLVSVFLFPHNHYFSVAASAVLLIGNVSLNQFHRYTYTVFSLRCFLLKYCSTVICLEHWNYQVTHSLWHSHAIVLMAHFCCYGHTLAALEINCLAV